MTILTTTRMRLEPFSDSHFEGLSCMNSQPEVMRYISCKPETVEETQASIERVKQSWMVLGYSWWSFIELNSNELIGAGCLQHLGGNPANPLEIGWRLRKDKWNRGYATEAARAMMAFAFETLKCDSLCAICHQDNLASAHIMEKLGMQYRGIDNTNDKGILIYSIDRPSWLALQ